MSGSTSDAGRKCTLLIGLAFKDADNQSVFPLAPVEILWITRFTSGMPDMGQGMEVAAPEIMDRPPQRKQGIFTLEVMTDILVYGVWTAAICLAAFSVRMWAATVIWPGAATRSGQKRSKDCELVFCARDTTFVSDLVCTVPGMGNGYMRPSFLRMQPKSKKYFTQRCLAQQVSLLVHHGQLDHHVPYPLNPCAERRRL